MRRLSRRIIKPGNVRFTYATPDDRYNDAISDLHYDVDDIYEKYDEGYIRPKETAMRLKKKAMRFIAKIDMD